MQMTIGLCKYLNMPLVEYFPILSILRIFTPKTLESAYIFRCVLIRILLLKNT